ncbi:MAG: CRISPR-associated helicase Cas3' [Desulforhopalus sp.]|nr:CRISPR-associated helicase Cas3' [Desulforhopalus sp.]
MNYFAHSENNYKHKHLAKGHLSSVSDLAAKFAASTRWKDESSLSGRLHDLGKYADLFQKRLKGEESGLDHWSPGMWVALEYHAVAAALAIQGHHIGLQSITNLRNATPANLTERHPLNLRLSDTNINRLKDRFSEDDLKVSKPDSYAVEPQKGFQNPVASMLDVRMLFSCLTDADFLDTEAHFEGNELGKRYRASGPTLDIPKAIYALEQFMVGKVRSTSQSDTIVRDARNSLWNMVVSSAEQEPGLFTLTAPTGSGKTLAMLKFALDHAACNGLKRLVLVVPYLSIIEQTAAIYRAIFQEFPESFVLEHHSMAGLGIEESKNDAEVIKERGRRLLSENWDAPIIITTNVQLLESLFSNRPSACRKLHNLMESVIMFDEAQTLPQSLAVPTLAALSHFSKAYRTTVLFATATQPAFDALDSAVRKFVPEGWCPIEVAPDHACLYDALRRYEVQWPKNGEKKDWVTLAEEIQGEKQVLCVVNLKSHTAAILREIRETAAVFHLSTNLCAYHRRVVLDEVRARLKNGDPCQLISTQCIEAGVDVDFPVTYRAMAPLDAIAQAAGRCNREGRLITESGKRRMGEVRVFEPSMEGSWRSLYPTFAYYQATKVTETMLIIAGETGIDLNAPAVFRDFYHRLYDLSKPEANNQELIEAFCAVDFVRVAREYRLIDSTTIQVLVPYMPQIDLFEELRQEQDVAGISAKWIRRAQGLAVSVFRPQLDHPAWGVLIPAKLRYGNGVSDEWFILEDHIDGLYDEVFGLCLPQSHQILIG